MVNFNALNEEEPEIVEQLTEAPPPIKRDPLDPAPLLDLFEKYVAEIKPR